MPPTFLFLLRKSDSYVWKHWTKSAPSCTLRAILRDDNFRAYWTIGTLQCTRKLSRDMMFCTIVALTVRIEFLNRNRIFSSTEICASSNRWQPSEYVMVSWIPNFNICGITFVAARYNSGVEQPPTPSKVSFGSGPYMSFRLWMQNDHFSRQLVEKLRGEGIDVTLPW